MSVHGVLLRRESPSVATLPIVILPAQGPDHTMSALLEINETNIREALITNYLQSFFFSLLGHGNESWSDQSETAAAFGRTWWPLIPHSLTLSVILFFLLFFNKKNFLVWRSETREWVWLETEPALTDRSSRVEFVLRFFHFASSNLSRIRAGYFLFFHLLRLRVLSMGCKRRLMIERSRKPWIGWICYIAKAEDFLDGTIGYNYALEQPGFGSLGHLSISVFNFSSSVSSHSS